MEEKKGVFPVKWNFFESNRKEIAKILTIKESVLCK